MALLRISAPSSSPSGSSDYTAIVNMFSALSLDKGQPDRIQGSNVKQGALFCVGGVLYQADADTAISGTASDYVQITASGASASAAFVSSLAGVAWAAAYRGYYDSSDRLYVFDEAKAFVAGVITAAYTERGRGDLSHGHALFIASGSWRCPLGVTKVYASGIGPGGPGGTGAPGYSFDHSGGGGGGGASGEECRKHQLTVVPGTLYTVTINSSTTTFGALLALAAGGAGANGSTMAGAAGGAPVTHAPNFAGAQGSQGANGQASPSLVAGGNGGAGAGGWGAGVRAPALGGPGGTSGAGSTGSSAAFYGGGGGGGGGGASDGAGGGGGAGKNGLLLLEW